MWLRFKKSSPLTYLQGKLAGERIYRFFGMDLIVGLSDLYNVLNYVATTTCRFENFKGSSKLVG